MVRTGNWLWLQQAMDRGGGGGGGVAIAANAPRVLYSTLLYSTRT